jgi:hypothetical protein
VHLQVVVKVLSSGVGDVKQSDVALAAVSKGVVFAFNVAADMQVRSKAGVDACACVDVCLFELCVFGSPVCAIGYAWVLVDGDG